MAYLNSIEASQLYVPVAGTGELERIPESRDRTVARYIYLTGLAERTDEQLADDALTVLQRYSQNPNFNDRSQLDDLAFVLGVGFEELFIYLEARSSSEE